MRPVAVVGVGLHSFGRFPNQSIYEMGEKAVREALSDANLQWPEVQAAFCGTVFSGRGVGDNIATRLGLIGIPVTNVENGCASSCSAFRQAYLAVAAGQYDVVLAMGVDKMPHGYTPTSLAETWEREAGYGITPAYMAMDCRRYMYEHGLTADHLAQVCAKNHRNGMSNPYAMYRREFTADEILNAKMICDPLTLFMLAPMNEGAGATILCAKEKVERTNDGYVNVLAATLCSPIYGESSTELSTLGALPMCCSSSRQKRPSATYRAAHEAYSVAQINPDDIDVAEVSDGSVWNEIEGYEALGFCNPGSAVKLIESGATGPKGHIPVNPNGGMECMGDPVGPTSIGQIAEIVWQLRGDAGLRQVAGATTGLAQSAGSGASGVVILQRE